MTLDLSGLKELEEIALGICFKLFLTLFFVSFPKPREQGALDLIFYSLWREMSQGLHVSCLR